MQKAPCKDCPKRMVACHCTCTDYIEFRKAKDIENEIIRMNKKKTQFDLAEKRVVNYIMRKWAEQ